MTFGYPGHNHKWGLPWSCYVVRWNNFYVCNLLYTDSNLHLLFSDYMLHKINLILKCTKFAGILIQILPFDKAKNVQKKFSKLAFWNDFPSMSKILLKCINIFYYLFKLESNSLKQFFFSFIFSWAFFKTSKYHFLTYVCVKRWKLQFSLNI